MRTLTIAVACLVTGCSLSIDPPSKSRLDIVIPGPSPEGRVFEALFSGTPPANSSGFDCLLVNIMGDGIPALFGNPQDATEFQQLVNGTTFCSYPGITAIVPNTPGVNSHVSLVVPSGPERLVQVDGLVANGSDVCSLPALNVSIDNSNAKPYEIGRAVVDLFTDTGVTVNENWNTLAATDQAARSLDCKSTLGTYANDVQSTTGLVVYWPLVDAPGSSQAQNYAGSIPNMTFSGGALPGVADPPFPGNETLRLPSGARAEVNQGTDFSSGTFSFEIWVKITTPVFPSAFFQMTDSTGASIELGCNASGQALFTATDTLGGTATAKGSPIADGAWHYLVGEKVDFSNVVIYVDGTLNGTQTGSYSAGTFAFTTPPDFVDIGYDQRNVSYQPGDFAQAAIYDGALPATTILQHYADAGFSPPPGPPPLLVAQKGPKKLQR